MDLLIVKNLKIKTYFFSKNCFFQKTISSCRLKQNKFYV